MSEKKLNDAQKQAVETTDCDLLIVAGAGTGKTTVIAEKIAHIINKKIARPDEILTVTFTEKATTELEERVTQLVPNCGFDMWVSTFHGFCQRVLEQHALDIGIPNNFKLLNEAETWLLIRKNLEKFKLDYYKPMGSPSQYIHTMIKHFQRCKDELITPKNYLDYAEKIRLNSDTTDNFIMPKNDDKNEADYILKITELSEAYNLYNKLLLENDSLDFADLLFYTVELFKKRPTVLRFYQNIFKQILVDEFQDTNWSQYELIKLLKKDSTAKLTVVGDDDQSIYKFRGASVSNILQFKNDFPGAKEIILFENYRSGQKILDFAYNFIQSNNPDRLESKLNINKRLISKTKNEGDISWIYTKTSEQEAQKIAKKIISLKNSENLEWKDFAILCRANNFARQFAPIFQHNDIPFESFSTEDFYKHRIILDSMAFLRAIDNYHESASIYRLLNMPIFNMEYEDLSKILFQSRKYQISLYECLKNINNGVIKISKNGVKNVELIINLMNDLSKEVKTEIVTKILYNFFEKSGYLKLLANNPEKYYNDILYLRTFFDKINEFVNSNADNNINSWIKYFDYIIESGEEGSGEKNDSAEDSVKIMSIHAAKGLEFECIFIPNMVDKRFPTSRRGETIEIPNELIRESALPSGDAHLQEERRLFYVAATRAKKYLVLSAAKDYGGAKEKKLSIFINETEEKCGVAFDRNTMEAENDFTNKKIQSDAVSKINNCDYTPSEFSFSQIQTYEKCPLQYKYQFILKIPTFGKGVFSFGKTMHSTLQKFYQKIIELNSIKQTNLFNEHQADNSTIKIPNVDELKQIYLSSWQDEWFSSPEQKSAYREKGVEILENFYKTESKCGWTVPLSLETGFRFRLEDNIIIKGQIDRIDKNHEGKLIVIDYKTGKVKDKIRAEDKKQLLIYQIAMETSQELRNLGEIKELMYYFLDNSSRQSFKGNSEEIQETKNDMIMTIQKIKSKIFQPAPAKEICKYCDFKDICDYKI